MNMDQMQLACRLGLKLEILCKKQDEAYTKLHKYCDRYGPTQSQAHHRLVDAYHLANKWYCKAYNYILRASRR